MCATRLFGVLLRVFSLRAILVWLLVRPLFGPQASWSSLALALIATLGLGARRGAFLMLRSPWTFGHVGRLWRCMGRLLVFRSPRRPPVRRAWSLRALFRSRGLHVFTGARRFGAAGSALAVVT